MSNENEILTELNALDSALGKLSKEMPFEIPMGYFEKLPEELTDISRNENEPLAAFSDTKKMPFDVPKNYFKKLPGQLTTTSSFVGSNTEQDEEQDVPEGYFESLAERLTAHVKAQESRKRLTISLGAFRKVRWAAAAVLLISASFGTMRYLQLRNAPDAVAARQLSKIDPSELASYVDQHLDEFDNDNIEAAVSANKVDVNSTLSNIDEASIQQYLNNTEESNPPSRN